MNIGLDYDDTITRDIEAFLAMIAIFRSRHHNVYITTMRYPHECIDLHPGIVSVVNGVYPTSRKAKEPFMFSKGIRNDVWIDDNPKAIYQNSEQAFGISPVEDIVIYLSN